MEDFDFRDRSIFWERVIMQQLEKDVGVMEAIDTARLVLEARDEHFLVAEDAVQTA